MPTTDLVTVSHTSLARPATAWHREVLDAWLEKHAGHTLAAYKRDLCDFARFLDPTVPGPLPASADEDKRRRVEAATNVAQVAAVEALLSLERGDANRLVMKYVAAMRSKKLSPATISRRLSALRSMVKIARTIGRVDWTLDVDAPRVESYRDTSGPGQAGYLMMWKTTQNAAADADAKPVDRKRAKRDLALLMLMRDLVLRRGSCASLDLADVNLEDEPAVIEVLVKGKQDKRRLTLPAMVRDVLADWIQERGQEPGPVFIRLDPGADGELRPLDGESINRIVRRAGKRAGLKRPTRAHGLRHQGTTRLLEKNNGNIPATMALTGHAKPETLMKYDDNRRNAAGKGSDLLAEDYGDA